MFSVMKPLDLNLGSTVKVQRMNHADCAPNHHAHHRPFAGIYGFAAALTMVGGREDDARLAIELAALSPAETVVDLGSGPGAAVRRAARLGAKAIGVDPAPVMRRVARVLTRSRAVQYVAGTAEDVPLADATADVVWSIATIHHWADVDQGLREVRRVLRGGGRFVGLEARSTPGATGHGSHGWTSGQAAAFAERVAAAGFVDVQVAEHPGGRHGSGIVSVTARVP
jgi:ubiquinone/menaquinone biosynthesis C-methylase UbiE